MASSTSSAKDSLVRVNLESSLPRPNQKVTVLGWGLTEEDNDDTLSPVLQGAELYTLSNEACEQSEDPYDSSISFNDQIYDDMLCAFSDSGKDACQGDSGGPLVMPLPENQDEDILLGVVSWGFGCGSEYFPGVYSRISYDADWVRRVVCEKSRNPPAYFNCTADEEDISPAENQLLATLKIQMDEYPDEIGWHVDRFAVNRLETVALRNPGDYRQPNELVEEKVLLDEGEIYIFKIFDTFQDGLDASNSFVSLTLDDSTGIFRESGRFGEGFEINFVATTIQPMPSIASPPGDIHVELEIKFDQSPEKNGFLLERIEPQNDVRDVIAFQPIGSYSRDLANEETIEIINLLEPGLYRFHFLDVDGNGICCKFGEGYYRLLLGSDDSEDNTLIILAAGNAEKKNREATLFEINDSMHSPATSPYSSLEPSTLLQPISETGDATVTIFIHPNHNPSDIGWKIISASDGRPIVGTIQGSYDLSNTHKGDIIETLTLPAFSVFRFVVDERRDPESEQSSGYFFLETSNGIVGFGRLGEGCTFTTPGTLPLHLNIRFDKQPHANWKIEKVDVLTSEVAVVSMHVNGIEGKETTNQSIEKTLYVTDGGYYRFTIWDKDDDTTCCEGSVYIAVDDRILISESGKITDKVSRHFFASQNPFSTQISNERTLLLNVRVIPEDLGNISWILLQENDDSINDIAQGRSPLSYSRNNKIVAYGPITPYYSSEYQIALTQIKVEPIPPGGIRRFTFIFNGKSPFVLSDSNLNTILNGRGTGREIYLFALNADGIAFSPSPTPPHSAAVVCRKVWLAW
eukprot:CAMPEP_0178930128 /NCGR_PEP_ID=MMETSP0786-20121207/21040_1 /TAXON_ID=186022 /ORGANISM="Thalassionema frauenfeldii, Strain CCMP 1798" /LENGTH=803 /DNA_ID=CAMNT_0020606575 /DNA_START=731 /DNA_END=3139 /DNA_ORIENTATION=-